MRRHQPVADNFAEEVVLVDGAGDERPGEERPPLLLDGKPERGVQRGGLHPAAVRNHQAPRQRHPAHRQHLHQQALPSAVPHQVGVSQMFASELK